MKIEVSNGEIIDKYTILTIKLQEINDEAKLANVKAEYDSLTPEITAIYDNTEDQKALESLHTDLLNVNKTLWNIEDYIRDCERDGNFGTDFVELARSVYFTNDDRANVKKLINTLTGSTLVEEKSYQEYV
tara:strand:+ start:3245 stop:3637 length:393 start_codon:yes stop_codon:yes gene_type:complete